MLILNEMCKATVTVLFYLVVCQFAFAQQKSTREEEGLKGPVSKVQTITSEIKRDSSYSKNVETTRSKETVSFDRHGRKTEEYSGFQEVDDSNKGKKIFNFDSDGKLREIILFDSTGKIENRLMHRYDDHGRLGSISGAGTFNLIGFTSSGVPIEMITRITYQPYGKTVEENITAVEKQLPYPIFSSVAVWRIGKLREEKIYAFGSIESYKTYTYDVKGRLTKMYETNPRELSSAEEHYSYDEVGNLKEINRYSRKHRALERKTVFAYEFDAIGNWLKKSSSEWVFTGQGAYRKGVSPIVPRTITRRVITYYK